MQVVGWKHFVVNGRRICHNFLSSLPSKSRTCNNGVNYHSPELSRTMASEAGDVAKRAKAEDMSVTNFREYLRINTVQPNPDYNGAVTFLTKMANELQLPFKIHEMVPNKPIFVMTWEGLDPNLPSVMLNSHIDVVPVFPEFWKHDPFEALKEDNGNIYARGSQDMKCVGQQYIEAIRKMKADGQRFLRTIHMTFVPDEEIGGHDGMEKFAVHQEFKHLNVGFALDEGLANPTDAFTVYYGERSPWWVEVKCAGSPGHGSSFIENHAGGKIRKVINSFLAFREDEEKKLNDNPNLKLGDVTTTNLTKLSGGVQTNVVPAELSATFDIRVTPTADLVALEEKIKQWCEDAGEGVTYTFLQKNTDQCLTPITKEDCWWNAFITPLDALKLKIETAIFPAATDSRYLRKYGYPAIGFSPMNHTPVLLHDHNEYLNEDIYLKGIDIYQKLIPSIANVAA